MLHVDPCRELLIGSGQAELIKGSVQHGGLQLVREISPLVEQGSCAVLVFSDGRPLPEEWMVVVRDGFGVLWNEEFSPVRNKIGVFSSHVEGIAFECQRVLEI